MTTERSFQIKSLHPEHKFERCNKAKVYDRCEYWPVQKSQKRALYDHEGGLIEHYGRLWDYRQALLESNPGSTCRLDVEETGCGKSYFKRFYICIKGMKDGWLEGCRRVIGLDGCFLKHTCRGELLTAMALLHDDLKLQQGTGLTLISDGHKGLHDAVRDWLPNSEHMKCTIHIYANFKKKFSDIQLQKLFWHASSCTVPQPFYSKMEEMKQINT
ncbi:retrovirus-related pol polyprotein from transposon TNT 1-94 [Tanacetum coccineum]